MAITKLSFGQSLQITVFAMALVFILLVFIALIMKLQTVIVEYFTNLKDNMNKQKNDKTIEIDNEEVEETNEVSEEVDKNSEYETVAAVMAALSAYIDVPVDKLNIKSIRRVNNLWGQTNLRNSLK